MGRKLKVVAAIGGSVAVLAVAIALLNDTQRPAITQGPPATPTTSSGEAPPPTDVPDPDALSIIKAFDPNISFNRPVSDFGRSEKYDQYADRFWQFGSYGGWDDTSRRGRLFLEMRNYSIPIYDARDATGTKRAFFANFGYPPEPGHNIDFPWNDSWEAAPGNDSQLLAANPDTGELWIMWAYQKSNPTTCLNLANLARGFTPFSDLCAGGVNKLMNEDGTVGDYRTWNSYQPTRGMGIPKLALVTTPYEVRSGVIPHALEMTVFNSMFGPACSDSEIDTDAAGSTCGFYVPPATRVEWATNAPVDCGPLNQTSDREYREKTIPEGMRFALDLTDADIEAWLDDRGYSEPLRSTARVFAVALRDYGFIIAETGCYGTSIEVDGMVNPAARDIWLSLGVNDTEEAGKLLDGLTTRDRLYVVNPPEPVPSKNGPKPGLGR